MAANHLTGLLLVVSGMSLMCMEYDITLCEWCAVLHSCQRQWSSWTAIIGWYSLARRYKTMFSSCGRCLTSWCRDFLAPSESSKLLTVAQYFRAVMQRALLKTRKLVSRICVVAYILKFEYIRNKVIKWE